MTPEEKEELEWANGVLIAHNQWRRGADIPMGCPTELGEAIDVITRFMKKYIKNNEDLTQ